MSGRKAQSPISRRAPDNMRLLSIPRETGDLIIETFVRAKSEAIVVNGEIVVTVIEIRDEEVVIAVEAPDWVEVVPEEVSYGAETMERAGIPERSP